ncbi:MAG: hypothetical protein Kow00103_15480 [Candidatus Caldatribacteriota bacterium]
MLRAIRTLALDFIFEKLGDKNNPPVNLDKWYRDLRVTYPDKLFPFLVESIDNIEKIYILQADADKNTVKLSVEDMTEEKALRLPFKQYRARAIGPVIKRSKNRDEVSPSLTTQNETLKYFRKVGKSGVPWAGYFREISEIIDRPKLKLTDNSIIETGENKKWVNVYSAALDLIPTNKGTVMVTIADKDGRWPGDRPEYRNYLIKELSQIKYCTSKVSFIEGKTCPLCGASGVTIFPNALRGAGINLTNFDRVGVFYNINEMEAWKRYGLCNACADLLYIYKFHLLKKDSNKRNPFITHIAGDTAIVIPFTTLDYNARRSMWRKVSDFVKSASSDVEEDEAGLLDILKEEKGILNLAFLWATVGQEISDVTGMITNVPPSRLTEISKINDESREWRHPLFPETFLRIKESNFSPDLSLRALRTLFYRPGDKKAKNANESMKLQQLKKIIAASIYHKTEIPLSRFWEEIMITARWYWLDAIERGNVYNLLYEGKKKTGEPYRTAAGWIRHLCWWIYYFKRLEVMNMEDNFYEPKMEQLKPFFGQESGINSSEKAYVFLLGVLYGKVLQVQGARGINVGANALTWLKRLTLKGSDIPGLYIKIRQKLLAYEIEKSPQVRDLITEIGRLGCLLGDKIELDEIPTNYYLLLGQSLTTTILPKKDDSKNQTGGK